MKNGKMLLPDLFSIALVCSLILPASAAGASATLPRPDDCSIGHWAVDSSSLAPVMALNTPQGNVTPMVAVGSKHTVGLESDGTVVAVGSDWGGQCDVGNWTDIVQVAAGWSHTVGLKGDGTAVAVGDNWRGCCDVGNWTNIVQVAAGGGHTVGLKSDGTVVAVGDNEYWQCNLSDWNLVLALPPSRCVLTISSTVGGSETTRGEGTLRHNKGTVVDLVAEPEEGYCFVNWTGDVDTIADVNAATTNITMNGDYSITANFVSVEAGNVSIKAGDWIKIEYKITGWPAGQPYPE